jgi:type II secretory ATPase GspE/PulE/Tfp pilus assembly ATPase PilB-like protein
VSQPTSVKQPIPVGKYFLDRGKINQKQLDLALRHREEFDLKLGQSLVELGFVTEGDMVEALRHQARFPCIHLTPGVVEESVALKLAEPEARRYRALVINAIAGHATVALEDPSDDRALEQLALLLDMRIFPVYAEPTTIRKLLDHVYGARKAPAKPVRPAEKQPGAALPRSDVFTERAKPLVSGDAPDEKAVVDRIRGFLQEAFEQNVTEIHLEPRQDSLWVRFRAGGALREHSHLPTSWVRPTIACLKALAKLDGPVGSAQEGGIPFLFKKQHLQVRVATLGGQSGESAVLHVVRTERAPRALAQLGLAEDQRTRLEQALAERRGLVLVAGPARSGRTTTLHALLAHLKKPELKVVALESEIEEEHEGVMQVTLDRKNALGVAASVRACLRQDPDVFLLGEIDVRDTAVGLLEAALDRRTVLAGLHARSACDALARFELEPFLLAEGLRAVLAQRIVRRICSQCTAPIVPDESLRARLGLGRDGATYHEGEGCAACQNTGYRGHVALFEVLTVTPAVRRALERGEDASAVLRAAQGEGFRTLRDQGVHLAREGLTTLYEVLSVAQGVPA